MNGIKDSKLVGVFESYEEFTQEQHNYCNKEYVLFYKNKLSLQLRRKQNSRYTYKLKCKTLPVEIYLFIY